MVLLVGQRRRGCVPAAASRRRSSARPDGCSSPSRRAAPRPRARAADDMLSPTRTGSGPWLMIGVAAEEVLALVGVVPVLGQRQRGRPLVPADFLVDQPQTAWLDCTIRFVPTRPELLARPSGNCGQSRNSAAGAAFRSRSRQRRRCAPAGTASGPRGDNARRSPGRASSSSMRPDHRQIADLGAGRHRARDPGDAARSAWRWSSSRACRSRDRRTGAPCRAAPTAVASGVGAQAMPSASAPRASTRPAAFTSCAR